MQNHHTESALYSVVLLAYPSEFRARFGREMIDTFSEQIRSQHKQNGWKGVLRVWCSALWEIVRVAAPLQLQGTWAPALLLSILASSVIILAFFAAVTPHCAK